MQFILYVVVGVRHVHVHLISKRRITFKKQEREKKEREAEFNRCLFNLWIDLFQLFSFSFIFLLQ